MRARRLLLPLSLLIIGVGAAALAHSAQRIADERRYERRLDDLPFYQPDGASMRVASLGFHTVVADLVWLRTVLQFAEIHDLVTGNVEKARGGVSWLRASLNAVITLDPRWRTPYFYGGGFLRVCGDLEGSDTVYSAGHAAFPDDPFFPFSLGMNAYLYRSDRRSAADWLQKAAALPTAPDWYEAAAAGFLSEQGERTAALRYLQEQLETETRPGVQEALRRKAVELMHDEYVEQIAHGLKLFRETMGREPRSLGELGHLPDDPYGEGWVIGADGVIRSAVAEESERRRGVGKERIMLLLPLPALPPTAAPP